MKEVTPAVLARALYAALAAGDRAQLDSLLHPEFTGRTAEGMPFGIGGDHEGPAAMRRNGWGAISRHFEAHAEPERFLLRSDRRGSLTWYPDEVSVIASLHGLPDGPVRDAVLCEVLDG